jgi:hypothetical protein
MVRAIFLAPAGLIIFSEIKSIKWRSARTLHTAACIRSVFQRGRLAESSLCGGISDLFSLVPIAGGGLSSSRKHEQGLRRGGGWAALEPAVSTGLTDENEVPSVADVAVTSVGDTWCMGCHRLACGDSTDANTVRLYSAHRNRT